MEFLNSQEKSQIKLILTKSSMLQTADERRNLLINFSEKNTMNPIRGYTMLNFLEKCYQ